MEHLEYWERIHREGNNHLMENFIKWNASSEEDQVKYKTALTMFLDHIENRSLLNTHKVEVVNFRVALGDKQNVNEIMDIVNRFMTNLYNNDLLNNIGYYNPA